MDLSRRKSYSLIDSIRLHRWARDATCRITASSKARRGPEFTSAVRPRTKDASVSPQFKCATEQSVTGSHTRWQDLHPASQSSVRSPSAGTHSGNPARTHRRRRDARRAHLLSSSNPSYLIQTTALSVAFTAFLRHPLRRSQRRAPRRANSISPHNLRGFRTATCHADCCGGGGAGLRTGDSVNQHTSLMLPIVTGVRRSTRRCIGSRPSC